MARARRDDAAAITLLSRQCIRILPTEADAPDHRDRPNLAAAGIETAERGSVRVGEGMGASVPGV